MRKLFGSASDFFEIKLYEIREVLPQEFDWDELTAYLGPRTPMEPVDSLKYEIQIIFKDNGKTISKMVFDRYEDAKLKFREVIDDLKDSEVMEFMEKYQILLED